MVGNWKVHLNPEVDIRTVLLSLNLPQLVFTAVLQVFISLLCLENKVSI